MNLFTQFTTRKALRLQLDACVHCKENSKNLSFLHMSALIVKLQLSSLGISQAALFLALSRNMSRMRLAFLQTKLDIGND